MNINIGDVAATSFVTLYCHAIESQSKDPILNDPKAVEITHELNKTFFDSNIKLERDFAEGKLDKQLVIHVAIRAKQYDKYVCDEVIEIKKQFFKENERYHFIASSVLNYDERKRNNCNNPDKRDDCVRGIGFRAHVRIYRSNKRYRRSRE